MVNEIEKKLIKSITCGNSAISIQSVVEIFRIIFQPFIANLSVGIGIQTQDFIFATEHITSMPPSHPRSRCHK